MSWNMLKTGGSLIANCPVGGQMNKPDNRVSGQMGVDANSLFSHLFTWYRFLAYEVFQAKLFRHEDSSPWSELLARVKRQPHESI